MTRPVVFQHTLSEWLALPPVVDIVENCFRVDTTVTLLSGDYL